MKKLIKQKTIKIGIAVIILAVLIGLISINTRSAQRKREYDSHVDAAEKYLTELDYEQAIAEYTLALEIEPNNEEVLNALEQTYLDYAQSLADAGEYEKAIGVLGEGYLQIEKESFKEKQEEIGRQQEYIVLEQGGVEEIVDQNEDLKKKSEISVYQVYYNKLIETQEKYGKCENVSIPMDDDPLIEENIYLKGLCFATLINFDNEGDEELLLAYRDPQVNSDNDFSQNYTVEIWSYKNLSMEKIYSGAASGDADHGLGTMIEKEDSGMFYLYQYTEEENLQEWYGYDGGKFYVVRSEKWAENGCEIDGIKVSEEVWLEETENWNAAHREGITYGFQNCGDLCKNSVIELNNTFEMLSGYLGIDWTEPIIYQENLSKHDISLWGKELTGTWENISYQSFAEWVELNMYADGTVGLHEHNMLYWGIYEIDMDGSVYLYLDNALFYSNADGELYIMETDICIHLMESGDNQHMNFQEIYDINESHEIKGSVILTRTGDIDRKSNVEEEVEAYRERNVE